ncbi:MAG: hypothetical protein ABI647_26070 [Gemmatimonadota bacterium]
MDHFVRTFLAVACASPLLASRAQSGPDVVEVVILSGPYAGTYKTPSSETVCMHAKQQKFTTVSWRGFTVHDPKAMSEAGVKVSNPEQAGPKRGDIHIAFGDPAKKPVVYTVTQEPVTMTIKGKGVAISFDGKTANGIRLRVNAKCAELEDL